MSRLNLDAGLNLFPHGGGEGGFNRKLESRILYVLVVPGARPPCGSSVGCGLDAFFIRVYVCYLFLLLLIGKKHTGWWYPRAQ